MQKLLTYTQRSGLTSPAGVTVAGVCGGVTDALASAVLSLTRAARARALVTTPVGVTLARVRRAPVRGSAICIMTSRNNGSASR